MIETVCIIIYRIYRTYIERVLCVLCVCVCMCVCVCVRVCVADKGRKRTTSFSGKNISNAIRI